MSKSTKSPRGRKPDKPRPDFPLFPHNATDPERCRWAKKIRGKLHYFGKWSDDPNGEAALAKYLDAKDDLHAGRTPRANRDGLTVRKLCNDFWNEKRRLLETGKLSERTFRDYDATCERIVEAFGRNRLVDDLTAEDFGAFRERLAKTRGPVALGNEIARTRAVFKFAYDQGLIDRPIRYGQSFNKPSKATLRKARAKNGSRMFEAAKLRSIIDASPQPLKAMVLLAVNCGFGNHDIANLCIEHVEWETGWVNYPRPKTGIDRRIPLWDETLQALREAVENRPEPKDDADAGCCFITKYGRRWVRLTGAEKNAWTDGIGLRFRRLLTSLDLQKPGRGFYSLRHVMQTVGEESRDMPAVRAIMGHADNSMSGLYREKVTDERLRAVTDVVHDWLKGGDDADSK